MSTESLVDVDQLFVLTPLTNSTPKDLILKVVLTHSAQSSLPSPTHSPKCQLSVDEVVRSRIMDQHEFGIASDLDDAFFVGDMGEVVSQHRIFTSSLPRVHPHYAVKCNPDPLVLKTLQTLGTNFDCASKGEIELVLSLGIDPSRIIYANPCKQISHLLFAKANGVTITTFDNADELRKIAQWYPEMKCVLRILADDSRSLIKLGVKFGADIGIVGELLEVAKELSLDVVGISFHVGSGCFDASAFSDAILLAKRAFDIGAGLGFKFSLLNIGGGFPGSKQTDITFDQIALKVNQALLENFPPHIRVIAEPGRFFVSNAFTLCVNVINRKHSNGTEIYHVNDGMYQSFNILTLDGINPQFQVIVRNGEWVYGKKITDSAHESMIFGPSSKENDLIATGKYPKLQSGDWLLLDDMGSYSGCADSNFNQIDKTVVIYTNSIL